MRGRFEALVTLASNWTGTATNATHGAPTAWTITAGTYYPTALATAFQTALNATVGPGWTVTPSWGESGTGLVTINGTGTWSITFTQADARTFFGLGSDIAARASAKTTDTQSLSVWLPDCPYWAPYDIATLQDPGSIESDLRTTESPTGYVKGIYATRKTVFEGLRWEAVSNARARAQAGNGVNTPFETWWTWTQLGEADGGMHAVCSKIAFYGNADTSFYVEYRISGMGKLAMPQTVAGWAGRFRIEIPRMVNQP